MKTEKEDEAPVAPTEIKPEKDGKEGLVVPRDNVIVLAEVQLPQIEEIDILKGLEV